MRGLQGKRILITGGASGIGAATAARFLEEGSVVCILDSSAPGRAKIVRELPALTAALPCDVTVSSEVQQAVSQAVAKMGAIDVLVNNAGISIRHNFLEITSAEWNRVLSVNLTGVCNVAQQTAQHMVQRGGPGVILQMASTNAF